MGAGIDIRARRYVERNFAFSWFKNAKTQPKFCFDCKREQCCNITHNRVLLNPIIRIPKKHASRTKWKQFFQQVRVYHGHLLDENFKLIN